MWAIFLGAAVATIIFAVINAVPGDPVTIILGEAGVSSYYNAAGELRHQLGLDLPLGARYVHWLGGLARGDFGRSLYSNVPVVVELGRRIPRTLELIVPAVLLGFVIGVPLGVFTATRRTTVWDGAITSLGLVGYSLPVFVTGPLLVYFFSIHLHWLPSAGYAAPGWDLRRFLVFAAMPVGTLIGTVVPIVMRMTRTTVLEILNEDFVRTAHAKGLAERAVLYKHAVRNALIPVVTVIGLQIGYLIGGTVIVELVFAWPGLSTYLFTGIFKRDYPVVQGVVLITSLMVIGINLLTDLMYGLLDPRVRYE